MNYYESHAQDYFDMTVGAVVSDSIEEFLYSIPQHSHILDLGCGSGRDSAQFRQHGHTVLGLDNSLALAQLAYQHTGYPVLVQDMKELNFFEHFDAIWAMASLLHLEKKDLPAVISRCSLALKPGGVFFSCYKMGYGQMRDENQRFFSLYQSFELQKIYSPFFSHICLKSSLDRLGRHNFQWINILAYK